MPTASMENILNSPTLDLERACRMIEEAVDKEAADNFKTIILLELRGRHYRSEKPNINFIDINIWWDRTSQGHKYWKTVNKRMREYFTNGEYIPEEED